MSLLKNLFGKKEIDGRLLGKWSTDKNDQQSIDILGDATMTFTPKGELIYEIIEGDRLQIIYMIFWTEDDKCIISDQPTKPRKEKTKYIFETGDSLILEFEGQTTRYIRTG